MKNLKISLLCASMLFSSSLFSGENSEPYIADIGVQSNIKGLERVKQILVVPPFLPKHQQKYSGKPRIIEME